MGATYSSLGRTKVLYATSLVLLGAKARFLQMKPRVTIKQLFLFILALVAGFIMQMAASMSIHASAHQNCADYTNFVQPS